MNKWPSGSIDYCIEEVVEVVLDEIYGRVQSEKEEENLPKKCKEIKSRKGLSSFKHIGQLIDFVHTTPKLLGIMDKYAIFKKFIILVFCQIIN